MGSSLLSGSAYGTNQAERYLFLAILRKRNLAPCKTKGVPGTACFQRSHRSSRFLWTRAQKCERLQPYVQNKTLGMAGEEIVNDFPSGSIVATHEKLLEGCLDKIAEEEIRQAATKQKLSSRQPASTCTSCRRW